MLSLNTLGPNEKTPNFLNSKGNSTRNFKKPNIITVYYSSGEERVGRSGCQDQNDMYFCFFAAVEEDSCDTNGNVCAFTCGIC